MIEGLLTQKPGREPQVGEVKCFTVEPKPAVNGKNAWVKVKNSTPDKGGSNYKILSVTPTGRTDQYGNISFNIVIEPTEAQVASVGGSNPPAYQMIKKLEAMSKDDYWQRKEDRDCECQAEQIRNKPRIERQHSQHMALLYLQVTGKGSEITHDKLRALIDWFQRDVAYTPAPPVQEQPEEEQF